MGALDDITISVSEHSQWRAAERFPWFDVSLIEGEVRAAFREGRVARDKPPLGFRSSPGSGVYAWTPDALRCYCLVGTDTALVVVTTMRAAL